MKKLILVSVLASLTMVAQAALKPGDKLQPYEIKNTATGEKYCQVCKYGPKSGKIVAFGKLNDEKFWADLKELQTLQDKYERLGVFAHVIDSTDAKAIQEVAKKNGITFPVVMGTDDSVDKIYKVNGESRVIYYAKQNNEIVWSNVGLDGKKGRQTFEESFQGHEELMLRAGRAREVSTLFKSESRHLDFYNWYEQKTRVTLGLFCF